MAVFADTFKEVIKLNGAVRVCPNPITGVLIRRDKEKTPQAKGGQHEHTAVRRASAS